MHFRRQRDIPSTEDGQQRRGRLAPAQTHHTAREDHPVDVWRAASIEAHTTEGPAEGPRARHGQLDLAKLTH